MNCKILTINASGSVPNGEKVKGMEIPQKRRDVVDKVIRDECPDIIFIQESTIQLKNFCTRYLKDLKYESIGPKDAGIIFDTSKFDFVEDPTTRLRHIYESKVIRGESADIFARMCARILKGSEEEAQPILFVCWHGPHKEPLDEKKKIYDDLCLLLSLYASEKQIQVVVGGDFNLNLNKDKNLEENPAYPDTLAVIDYMKLESRPNKIDFILTSPKIIVVDCKPVDVFSITKNLFPELTEPFVKAVLDHDPIVVNVNIPNQEEEFSTFSELNLTKPYHGDIECLNQFLVTETKPYQKGFEPLDQLSMTKPYNFFYLHYYLPYLLPIPLSNKYYNDHIRFLLPMPPLSQNYNPFQNPRPMPQPIQYYNPFQNPRPMPPPSQYYNPFQNPPLMAPPSQYYNPFQNPPLMAPPSQYYNPFQNPQPMPPPSQYYNPFQNPWPMPQPIQYYNPFQNPQPMPPPSQYYNPFQNPPLMAPPSQYYNPFQNPRPMSPPSQYYNPFQKPWSMPPPSQYHYPFQNPWSMPPHSQYYNPFQNPWSMAPPSQYYNDHPWYPLLLLPPN